MAFCPRCDAQNADNAASCSRCGSPLTAGTMVMGSIEAFPRPKVALRIVRADGGPEAVLQMKGDVLTCGKQADLPLPDDPFVAPVQARFFFSGGRLAVEDIGGGNGVFVRLRAEKEIPIGGELRVGRQKLIVEPIPAVSPGPGGVLVWGSPDQGYKLRLLVMLEGGHKGAAFPLRTGENMLGRENGDITFPTDGFVSGRHALFSVQGDRLLVKDVGSSNGTFLRLTGPSFVDNGDQYLIGRQLVRVEVGAA